MMVVANKLNYAPAKGGISDYYSPRQLLHKVPLDFNKHCVYPFGAYIQAHHELLVLWTVLNTHNMYWSNLNYSID